MVSTYSATETVTHYSIQAYFHILEVPLSTAVLANRSETQLSFLHTLPIARSQNSSQTSAHFHLQQCVAVKPLLALRARLWRNKWGRNAREKGTAQAGAAIHLPCPTRVHCQFIVLGKAGTTLKILKELRMSAASQDVYPTGKAGNSGSGRGKKSLSHCFCRPTSSLVGEM